MTTKEAFDIVLKLIENSGDLAPGTKRKVADKMRIAQRKVEARSWTKESIIQALNDFKIKNGRAPKTNDLAEYGMPKINTIQSVFHDKPSNVLKQLFPENEKKVLKNRYYKNGLVTEKDWLNCFRTQVIKMQKQGKVDSKIYNCRRDSNTPTWGTIAAHLGLTTWSDLVFAAGFEKQILKSPTAKQLHINSSISPSFQIMEKMLEDRRNLNRELYIIMHTKKEKHPTKLTEKYSQDVV